MSDNRGSIAGWNSTDDEVPVPVRTTLPQAEIAAKPVTRIDAPVAHAMHELRGPNPKAMTASAVLGILLAIGGVVTYLGLDIGSMSLSGSILQSSSTVTITEGGTFSPRVLTVNPGQSITIENAHADPQVLKSKNNRELFPVQVIFDTPYVFTVPSDASGEYVYFSETLPEDRTVTFTVRAASSASEVNSSVSSTEEIPIDGVEVAPVTTEPPAIESSSSSSVMSSVAMVRSSSSSVSSTDSDVAVSKGTATIAIGSSTAHSSVSSSASSTAIPVNPYTVGTTSAVPVSASVSTSTTPRFTSISNTSTLHSGAPLNQTNYVSLPRSVPSTGLPGFALFFLPALGGVFVMSKKRG